MYFLAPMWMMLEATALDPTVYKATSGTLTAAIQKTRETIRAGVSLAPSLGGPIAPTVRLILSSLSLLLTEPALVGTILAYVFYWLAVIATLVYLKFSEASLKGATKPRLINMALGPYQDLWNGIGSGEATTPKPPRSPL